MVLIIGTFIRPLWDLSHLVFFFFIYFFSFSLIILSGNFKGPCKMGEAEKFERNYLNWKVLMQMQHEQLCRAQSLRCLLWPRAFAQDRTVPCHLWSGAVYALFFLAITSVWKIQCSEKFSSLPKLVFSLLFVFKSTLFKHATGTIISNSVWDEKDLYRDRDVRMQASPVPAGINNILPALYQRTELIPELIPPLLS